MKKKNDIKLNLKVIGSKEVEEKFISDLQKKDPEYTVGQKIIEELFEDDRQGNHTDNTKDSK